MHSIGVRVMPLNKDGLQDAVEFYNQLWTDLRKRDREFQDSMTLALMNLTVRCINAYIKAGVIQPSEKEKYLKKFGVKR